MNKCFWFGHKWKYKGVKYVAQRHYHNEFTKNFLSRTIYIQDKQCLRCNKIKAEEL